MNIHELIEKDQTELTIEEQIFLQNYVIETMADKLEETGKMVVQQNQAILKLHERLKQLENKTPDYDTTKPTNATSSGIITSLY
ncbi:hypothetical protein VmeM32_00147 [Vibrio phage vB_VmeM-32]|nr:hypothetical protein VmeM32_00147 [Vibrio phage vB_VmeM-32]